MTVAPPSATGPAGPGAAGPQPPDSGGRSPAFDPVRLGPAAAGRCRRRVHLDADPSAPRAQRADADDGLRLRLADGSVHRDRVLDGLRTSTSTRAGSDWAWRNGDRPAVVLDAALRSDSRFGAPDMLVWTGTGYRPVIIRSHRTTDPGSGAVTSRPSRPLEMVVDGGRRLRSHPADALALAHHHRLLADLGLAPEIGPAGHAHDDDGACAGVFGGVIGRGADDGDTIVWHRLDQPGSSVLEDYDRRFADRLAVATAAANGATPLALPSRIGECRRCSWWPVCSVELTAARDISLLVAGSDVEVLQAAGIRTADDLSRADRLLVAALPLTGTEPATARVRARAWLANHPLVRRREQVTIRRADLELDVDMESMLEDGAYLWGTYLTGPGVRLLGLTAGYRAFVSWRPLPDPDEGRAFAQFWACLDGLRSLAAVHGLTFAAYCYSRSAEERWMRSTPQRYPRVPGMPSAQAIEEFCSSPQWVDIYQEIRDQFLVPGSMRLKALAPLAGFSWRDPDPGGENSMAWYRAAVGSRTSATGSRPAPEPEPEREVADQHSGPVDQGMANRILRYNEDDVLATLALRRWMTDRAGEVPSVAELDTDEQS